MSFLIMAAQNDPGVTIKAMLHANAMKPAHITRTVLEQFNVVRLALFCILREQSPKHVQSTENNWLFKMNYWFSF